MWPQCVRPLLPRIQRVGQSRPFRGEYRFGDNMTALQRLVRNIATNWFGLLVNIVISFFLAPFVVNKLGSTYYGVWAITMQFTGYLYLLDFGVRDAVVRYASKYRAINAPVRLNEIIRVALEAYSPIFVVAIAFSIVGAWAFPYIFSIEGVPVGEARIVVLLVGLTIAQTFVFNVFVGVLHGFQRFDIGNYIGVLSGLLRAGSIVLILNAGFGIVGLSAIQLAVSLASGAAGYWLALATMRREGFRFRWVVLKHRRRMALIRRMVGYSIYVFINNIGQKTSVAAGPIIIGIFMPVAAVTPYAIAGNLAGYAKSLILSSAWVFNPLVSHYASLKDSATLTEVIRRGAKLPIVVGLPVTIAYVLIGDVFIGLWMGPQYVVDAAAVLFVLAFMETLSAPHHVMAAALYGMSKHQSLAVLRVIEAAANIALSVVLVKTLGIIGVAIGGLIPHVVLVLVLLPLILRKYIHVSFFELMRGIFVRPLLGAIPFALAVYWTYDMLPPESLVGFFARIAMLLPIYAMTVYAVSLDGFERGMVRDRLANWFGGRKGSSGAEKNSLP